MRKLSLAHAPRSICLQRSLQKGRYTFAGLYTLSPPQLGQVTMRAWGGVEVGSAMLVVDLEVLA